MSTMAHTAIAQLVEWGVVDFCICPGSRSTPLTLAVARHPIARSHIFHDERSATFCALGFGKAGKLAALITTSGTAVANALPAVVEANMAGIPLLLMTADRPPELRYTNANQTIDQVKIFGNQTRFFFDIPCDSTRYSMSEMQTMLGFAVSKCFGANSGPVHLNWMFREPFTLKQISAPITPIRKPTHGLLTLSPTQEKELADVVQRAQSGLIVVGELTDITEIDALKQIVQDTAWPMIIDASSGFSLIETPQKVLAFEDILRNPPVEFTPDVIVQFGNGLCTKRYERWLKTLACPVVVLNRRPISSNPGSISLHRYQVHIQTLDWIAPYFGDSSLLKWVYAHNNHVQQAVIEHTSWSELQVLQESVSSIPKEGQVFIGNSMPIRDLNNYVDAHDIPVYSNRGASGIDGLPSTALGIHLATDKPTLLVLGDLSLMHDFGVLFTLKGIHFARPFIIVVINNFGGGIFGMLPVSKEADVFDTHFATAHSHSLSPVTKSMGIPTHMVDDVATLQRVLQECWQQPGLSIIEAIVDRETSKTLRSTIRDQIVDRMTGDLP